MLTQDEIMAALATVPDPEMPVSIVDLGLVENIEIHQSRASEEAGSSSVNQITVCIDILPTFVGCPALPLIQEDIVKAVIALDSVEAVAVRFINDPPWTVDRISDSGRESLREFGVTVPESGSHLPKPTKSVSSTVELTTPATITCPFCDSSDTRLESEFGPTRCRTIRYCESCKNTFEHLKRL